MHKLLRARVALLGVGAVVFSTTFAAAASLTVNTDALPQSGSDVSVVCDADGVDIGYTVVGANVTAIVVSDDDCATGEVTLATTAAYTFVETATQANAGTVTYTLGAEGGAASPISISSFDPGTVTVTLVPNP